MKIEHINLPKWLPVDVIAHFIFGGFISYFAWHVNADNAKSLLPLFILVMIFEWGQTKSKAAAVAMLFGYYLQFASDIPHAYANFMHDKPMSYAYAGWILHALILACRGIPLIVSKWCNCQSSLFSLCYRRSVY